MVLAPSEIAKTFGGRLGLDLGKVVGKPLPELWRDGRRMPLVLDHPYRTRVRVALELPRGMGLDRLPEPVNSETKLVTVADRYALTDGTLWWDRDLVVRGARRRTGGLCGA